MSVNSAATVLSGDRPTKTAASAPFLLHTYCTQKPNFSEVPRQAASAACYSTRQYCNLLELGRSEQSALKRQHSICIKEQH